jgi:hypothetical protein
MKLRQRMIYFIFYSRRGTHDFNVVNTVTTSNGHLILFIWIYLRATKITIDNVTLLKIIIFWIYIKSMKCDKIRRKQKLLPSEPRSKPLYRQLRVQVMTPFNMTFSLFCAPSSHLGPNILLSIPFSNTLKSVRSEISSVVNVWTAVTGLWRHSD